ncbi:unnamed protein product [Acanthoscelides obtectus]|uniref:Uncharacterized protein n=1 Tax=Acanthoscelides obtectus TaxID=200917 RepID=A0A9P0P963_ACAOB|nr:unnamed protein product [Acanthoscelides obtectus]CAK1657614.1 hypothetical protein AOBTE_LOCUS20443 [Acanthoscelides obtectus]
MRSCLVFRKIAFIVQRVSSDEVHFFLQYFLNYRRYIKQYDTIQHTGFN